MKQPLVSVVIPNYNYAPYLRETIDSVLSQSYAPIEVVVVDDGSTDNSLEVLRAYGRSIKVIQQRNQGVSAARNLGVQESSGEYVAFLDADDVWLPTKVEKQVARFQSDADLGLVHVGLQEVSLQGDVLRTRLEGLEGWVSHELLLLSRAVVLGAGSGAMIPREVFREVGGCDSRLSTSADWDLCYRISRRYRVGFVPEVLFKYRMHSSNMHGNIRVMEHDMLLAFEKAFASGSEEVQQIRNLCYSNLHRTLSGCYFQVGQYSNFLRHTWKSIWLAPNSFFYFAKFPLRRLRRWVA